MSVTYLLYVKSYSECFKFNISFNPLSHLMS